MPGAYLIRAAEQPSCRQLAGHDLGEQAFARSPEFVLVPARPEPQKN
jgi:hypothetical protein